MTGKACEQLGRELYRKTAADDSSYLGRVGQSVSNELSSAIDNPWKSLAVAPTSFVPGLSLLRAPITDTLNMPAGNKGKEYLDTLKAQAEKRKGHFGQSFVHGVSQYALPSVVIGLLTGLGTAAYASAHPQAFRSADVSTMGLSAGGAATLSALLTTGAGQALADTILARTSNKTSEIMNRRESKHRFLMGLPLGSLIGSIPK